jgi:predicted TIM-barrel fold metal-dependent hydrolase
VAIHIGGEGLAGQVTPPTGSGVPASYYEYVALSPQGIMTHLASLILHGVFEKFPGLRVLLVEGSTAWLPWLLWRLDTNYKALRRDAPWLKRRPSEYFYDHIRVTTQPLDSPDDPEELVTLLSYIGGQDILCYSSDYPHWDADELSYITRVLPKDWLPNVLRENAMKLYGWKDGSEGVANPDHTLQKGAA